MNISLLQHCYIPAGEGEPAESYEEFTCCDCGLTNQVPDYAGEPSLPCDCGSLVTFGEDFLDAVAA